MGVRGTVAAAVRTNPTVRRELPEDAAAIRAVHRAAFAGDAEADIVDALRAAGRLAISLVAGADSELVGHIAFSPVSAGGGFVGLGLAPLGVVPSSQRRGIGSRLVREGLEAARRTGAVFVVVIGEPAYYERFGFRSADRWQLREEFGAAASFQVLELRAGAAPRGALVQYAPEFLLTPRSRVDRVD